MFLPKQTEVWGDGTAGRNRIRKGKDEGRESGTSPLCAQTVINHRVQQHLMQRVYIFHNKESASMCVKKTYKGLLVRPGILFAFRLPVAC